MITALIERSLEGDAEAHEELRIAVHDLILAKARLAMRGESKGHTLQVTALANEIWRTLDRRAMAPIVKAGNSLAAKALVGTMIRNFLKTYGGRRRKRRDIESEYSRESTSHELSLDFSAVAPEAQCISVAAANDALEKLAELDEEASLAFGLKAFAGLRTSEAAEWTGRSKRTVQLAFNRARLLLARNLERSA